MNTNLSALSQAGVAVWLDDLSRDRLEDGSLARLVEDMAVVGVTTNPSIFQAAITGSGSLRLTGPHPGRSWSRGR